MKKKERELLKKLEKVVAHRLDIMLTLTETMAKLCESDMQMLEGIKALARTPEGDEHEPEPEKVLDDEEYDGYVQYTEYVEEHDGNFFPDHPVREQPHDEIDEATPEQWEAIQREEEEDRIRNWGWIG